MLASALSVRPRCASSSSIQASLARLSVVPHAEVPALDAQRLAHAEERVKDQFLGDDAEAAAGGGVVADDVVAEHRDVTAAGTRQTGQDADQRCLAGAVGAEQPEEFTGLDVETHVVERSLTGWGAARAPA